MTQRRSWGNVLVLAVLVSLVGHLWMQTNHAGGAAAASAVEAPQATAHGHSDDHSGHPPTGSAAQQCPVTASGPQPHTPTTVRCATVTPVVHVWTGVPPVLRWRWPDTVPTSPRAPEHGVVLVL